MEQVTHSFLVEQGAIWLMKKASNILYKCQYITTELVCNGVNEVPDIFGLRPYGSVLIEVKTSRNDFKNDSKKRGRNPSLLQIGNRRFYLTPKDMLKLEELPLNWGLLEWDGKKIEVIKHSEWFEQNENAVQYIYHSILRRHFKPQIFNFKKTKD